MTKRILMPVDHFPRADAVAAIVADFARGSHAVVRLLHVAPQRSAVQDAKGRVVAFVDQEMESLKCEGLDALRPLEDARALLQADAENLWTSGTYVAVPEAVRSFLFAVTPS
jgi:hypothetical protein